MITIDGFSYSFGNRLPKNAANCPQFILLRLLMGTADVSRAELSFKQRDDYTILPVAVQTDSWTVALAALNVNYNSSLRMRWFLKKAISDNRAFFRDILNEFANYFLQTSKKCHIAAFVSLYRTLELTSYSAPLLYCSTQRDFSKTFEYLRMLVAGDKGGELMFFKNFLKTGSLIDLTTLDAMCDIYFTSENGFQEKYFNAAIKCYKKFDPKDLSRYYLGFQERGQVHLQAFELLRGGR